MEPSVAAQAASLQRQLDDCRASLAAALARLEVVRTRERHLLQEISRGSDPGSDHGGPTVPASPSGRPGVEDTAGGPSSASPPSPRPSRRKAAFPAFIVHQEGRRRLQVGLERQRPAAPGGLLLSQDELLIVQVLAHIPREAYGGLAPCHPGSPSGRLLPAKLSSLFGRNHSSDKDKAANAPERGSSAGSNSSGSSSLAMQWRLPSGGAARAVLQADPATAGELEALLERWVCAPEGPSQSSFLSREPGGSALSSVDADGEPGPAQPEGNGAGGPAWAHRPSGGGGKPGRGDGSSRGVALVAPQHMQPAPPSPLQPAQLLSEPSDLLTPDHLALLTAAIPSRYRHKRLQLAYSTARHGISLATLYRRSSSGLATITLVRDNGGYLFGCYTPEPWRIAPRFYGGGETFVFQLEPHALMWPWAPASRARGEYYFMYSQPDCTAVGGAGHFALWLDGELLHGSSGACATFGSSCLAHAEEFKLKAMEVWQVVA